MFKIQACHPCSFEFIIFYIFYLSNQKRNPPQNPIIIIAYLHYWTIHIHIMNDNATWCWIAITFLMLSNCTVGKLFACNALVSLRGSCECVYSVLQVTWAVSFLCLPPILAPGRVMVCTGRFGEGERESESIWVIHPLSIFTCSLTNAEPPGTFLYCVHWCLESLVLESSDVYGIVNPSE